MSFEKLVLSPSSLAELYGGSIVLTGEVASKPDKALAMVPDQKEADRDEAVTATGFPFLGQNQQHISLLVKTSGKAIVPASHLKFLTKMLEACKLGIDDVAIINHAQNGVDQKSLRAQLAPKSVVLFGITAGDIGLPLDFPQFQLYNYDGVGYLQVPALEELNSDTEQAKLLKTKLWVCLRQLFQV